MEATDDHIRLLAARRYPLTDLSQSFPGYRIITVPSGFRIQCRECFGDRRSDWRPPRTTVDGLAAARRWVTAHEHLLTFEQAKAEVLAAAALGHKGAKQWLAGKGLIEIGGIR